jgi:2-polyprenyl-3-methyl-5-hydroxy-6-metoxy-1,4-benzoquinol methylase
MFIGRECYKHTEFLTKLLDERTIRAKATSKWLLPILKIYVRLFGVPDIGFQLRARYVRKIVSQIPFSSALDAGCGIGLNSLYLAQKFPASVVDACDLTPGLVQAAVLLRDDRKLKNVNFFTADLTQLTAENKYDLIFCIDVIEHIPDDGAVPRNFTRALKDGGTLVLSTPHKRHINRRINGLHYDSLDHVREGYTEKELREMLQNNNLEVKQVRNVWGFWGEYCEELYLWTILHFPAPFAALSFPVLSVFSSLDMLTKNRQGYGLMVVAQKNNSR